MKLGVRNSVMLLLLGGATFTILACIMWVFRKPSANSPGGCEDAANTADDRKAGSASTKDFEAAKAVSGPVMMCEQPPTANPPLSDKSSTTLQKGSENGGVFSGASVESSASASQEISDEGTSENLKQGTSQPSTGNAIITEAKDANNSTSAAPTSQEKSNSASIMNDNNENVSLQNSQPNTELTSTETEQKNNMEPQNADKKEADSTAAPHVVDANKNSASGSIDNPKSDVQAEENSSQKGNVNSGENGQDTAIEA